MTTNKLSICSYNMGSDIGDYNLVRQFIQPGENGDHSSDYELAEHNLFPLLDEQADVYCLQEFGKRIFNPNGGPPAHTASRPLINSLTERGFTIIQKKSPLDSPDTPAPTDAAIALNTKRFENVENHSINQWYAIAIATDKITQKRIAFISAHVPGFNLSQPLESIKKENQGLSGPYLGDQDCIKLTEKLAELEGVSDLQIIGADMNASSEKWNPRFEIFKEQNFRVIQTGSPTAVNSKDPTYQEREIDYVLVKNPKRGILERILSQWIIENVKVRQIVGFETWDLTTNPSDHKPIKVEIITDSPLTRLRNAIKRLFMSILAFFRR